MILILGEILFDLFPDSKRIGGAPFNFAFHLKKLGFPVRFVSRVGKDDLGRQILDFLNQHEFDVKDIQIDPDHDTGTVQVTMEKNFHTFRIIPDSAWAHLSFDKNLSSLVQQSCDLLYFGSLVQHSQTGLQLIQRVIHQKRSKTKVFCDINLRPNSYTPAIIKNSLGAADILKLNQEELKEISDMENNKQTAQQTIELLMNGHDLEWIILTLGKHGSQWISREKAYQCPPIPQKKIVDTVGAGDAYAAISAAGWLKGLPVEKIMGLASEFAGHICEIPGALPEDEAIYHEFRQQIQTKAS